MHFSLFSLRPASFNFPRTSSSVCRCGLCLSQDQNIINVDAHIRDLMQDPLQCSLEYCRSRGYPNRQSVMEIEPLMRVNDHELFGFFGQCKLLVCVHQVQFAEDLASGKCCEQIFDSWKRVRVHLCGSVDRDFVIATILTALSRFTTSTIGTAQFENCTGWMMPSHSSRSSSCSTFPPKAYSTL